MDEGFFGGRLPLAYSGHVVIRDVTYTGEQNGRGVFASCDIGVDTCVDVCPCISFTMAEHDSCSRTPLHNYTFRSRSGRCYLALGLGSLFNHSDVPNVQYRIDAKRCRIEFTTCRQVNRGEELVIYYGPNLWFGDAGGSRILEAKVDELPLPFADAGVIDV
jgi:hypothetical protein